MIRRCFIYLQKFIINIRGNSSFCLVLPYNHHCWFQGSETSGEIVADDEYIIKTKFGDSFEFVFVKKNELSFEKFCVNGKYFQFHGWKCF